MNEPDIRITQYEITDDGSYSVGKGQTEFPQRAWRDLKEVNATGLFHITKGFALFDRKSRITSYNVCYTKLLREDGVEYTCEKI